MASKYFEMFYEDVMMEAFEKNIIFNPVVTDYGDRIESVQDFETHNIKYRIIGTFASDMMKLSNALNIEFMNVDKNSYEFTNDCPSPSEVFGIVFNWTSDYLKDTKHIINHIIVDTENINDSKKFEKRSRLYMKIIDRFLQIHTEFFNNTAIEKILNKKRTEYVLFAITRTDLPEDGWKARPKSKLSGFKNYFNNLFKNGNNNK